MNTYQCTFSIHFVCCHGEIKWRPRTFTQVLAIKVGDLRLSRLDQKKRGRYGRVNPFWVHLRSIRWLWCGTLSGRFALNLLCRRPVCTEWLSVLYSQSCIIKRYCEKRFVSKYLPTIGIDYGVTRWVPLTVCLVCKASSGWRNLSLSN